jgi:DNA-binding transcriptional ArsR family regulator
VEGLALFHALGNYTDRAIIELLLERKMVHVQEIHEHLSATIAIKKPNVSYRLSALREAGLVEFVPHRTRHYYFCSDDAKRTIETLLKIVQIANAVEPLQNLVIA